MQQFALNILDLAMQRGVSYADVRVVERRVEHLSVENDRPAPIVVTEETGFGLRVQIAGVWGFAANNNLGRESVAETVERALTLARASAQEQATGAEPRPFAFPPRPEEIGTYATEVEQDPFAVPGETRLALLLACCEAMQRRPAVRLAQAHLRFRREHKWFVSSEGSRLEQTIVHTGGGVSATAEGDEARPGYGGQQRRSFANYAQAGYEFITGLDLPAQAERCADEAEALLAAPPCPAGVRTVILGSALLARQIYETCGHPAELDRVLGREAPCAGSSFLTLDQLGVLPYGSPAVTIVADATLPGGLGTFGWDDEGTVAERFPLIDRGRFVAYLTSRETAWWLACHYRGTSPVPPLPFSNGAMRADGWAYPPLIRVTNLSLEPGHWTLDDLIAATDDGLFLDTARSWSLDDKHLRFHFGVEVAYEIKNGRLGRLLRDAGYTDETPRFWNRCDAVCNADHWQLWGLPDCSKGEPAQIAAVSLGAAPARFRGVQLSAAGRQP